MLSCVYWPIMFPSHEMPVQLFCPFFYEVFLLIWLSILYIKATCFVVGYLCCKSPLTVCARSAPMGMCGRPLVQHLSLRFATTCATSWMWGSGRIFLRSSDPQLSLLSVVRGTHSANVGWQREWCMTTWTNQWVAGGCGPSPGTGVLFNGF